MVALMVVLLGMQMAALKAGSMARLWAASSE